MSKATPEQLEELRARFPNSIYMNVCDRAGCGNPISYLSWRTRDGSKEYCSQACYDAAEGRESKTKRRTATMANKPNANTPLVSDETSAKQKRGAKKAPAKKATKQVPAKKAPAKKASAPAPAEKIAGRYRPTSSVGRVFQLLSDGKPHTLKEIEKASPDTKWPKESVWFINKHGSESGDWHVDHDKEKGTYTLVMSGSTKRAAKKTATKKAPAKKATTKKTAARRK